MPVSRQQPSWFRRIEEYNNCASHDGKAARKRATFLICRHLLDSRLKDYDMRKGFTRKPQADEPATRGKNYITPSGLQRLKEEHRFLLTRERPAVTKVVAWAAGNGDRSENAD